MEITAEQRNEILELIKRHILEKGNCRVGWAIEQIAGESFARSIHWKEKIANTIIQSGKYSKEPSQQVSNDWNIYLSPGHDRITRMDKLNLSFNILNFLCVIGSITIAIWGIRASENIAEKSGAYDQGQWQLSFFGHVVNENRIEAYYAFHETDTNFTPMTNLNFKIQNVGKKSMESAKLKINYQFKTPTSDEIKRYDAFGESIANRKWSKFNNEIWYDFDLLNPDISINVEDWVYLKGETAYFKISAIDSNKNTIGESDIMKVDIPFHGEITLTAKDLKAKNYNLTLFYKNEDNIDKLLASIIKEKVVNAQTSEDNINRFFIIIPSEKIKYPISRDFTPSVLKLINYTVYSCFFDKTSSSVVLKDQREQEIGTFKITF